MIATKPTQKDKLALAKVKINNICQEINQEVYRLMIDALQTKDPEEFLRATFDFVSSQTDVSIMVLY